MPVVFFFFLKLIKKIIFLSNLKLVYSEEFDFNGIHAYKFVVPASEFDFTLEENKIYCNYESEKKFYPEQKKNCLPNGLLDISRCQKGNLIFKKNLILL